MKNPITPTIVYLVEDLRKVFQAVRDTRIEAMIKDPLPKCENPLLQPCPTKDQAVSATLSLEVLKGFKDHDYIGLVAPPEELASPADKTGKPFHQSYLANQFVILTNEQVQKSAQYLQALHIPEQRKAALILDALQLHA